MPGNYKNTVQLHPTILAQTARALSEKWETPEQVLGRVRSRFPIHVVAMGYVLGRLVKAKLADVQVEPGKHSKYRRGTGQTIHLPRQKGTYQRRPREVREMEKELDELRQSRQPESAPTTPPTTRSAPSVIPAGSDILVFSRIAKIREEEGGTVAVFWSVSDGHAGLVRETYRGEAAKSIREAFEQRLIGWVSVSLIASLRATIAELEKKNAQLDADNLKLTGQLSATLDKLKKAREELD